MGVPEGVYLAQASPEGLAHFEATVSRLEAAGYVVKRVGVMPDFEAVRERHNLIVAAEAARVHADWFARYADLYHPKTAELIRRGQQVTDEMLARAINGRLQLRQTLTDVMNTHGIDLWISPAAPGPAPRGLDSTGDPVMNLPWTHSGLPTLTIPSGFNGAGLPLGLQLTGRWYGDELMVSWGVEIEQIVAPKG
ncbi:MAG: hypothetical protein D6706_00290 [Chloroflexi bacterium]|nr:MAG: hypothetical protein D6706_00290 [Chloroflexota bacterium]